MLFLFVLVVQFSFAQTTTVEFTNKSYINDSIFILKYSDYISKNIDTVFKGKIDTGGHFSGTFKNEQTNYYFIPLNYYNIVFYAQANRLYSFILPDKKKLDIADELNPYFEPVEVTPGIINSDSTEINYLINDFDICYNNILYKDFKYAYHSANKTFTDSVVKSLSKRYEYSNNKYFKTYIKYKFNMLKYLTYERDDNFIIKYYFNNEQQYLNNTSYMEMFNQIFKDYLSNASVKKWGENIYSDIAKAKSPYALNISLKNNPALSNDTLIDLIILKGINDALYVNSNNFQTFPQKQLLLTLDSMTFCAKTDLQKQIAKNIQKKFNYLTSVKKATNFSMLNQDSIRISFSDLKGKFLYLHFCDIRSYSAVKEMEQINIIAKKFSKELEVVTICNKSSLSDIKKFLEKNKFSWQFLIPDNSKQILKSFNIKSLTSYVLLDPYGNIILSQAPPPDLSFEKVFINILRKRN